MSRSNNNNPVKKSAQGALNRFKMEVANELGIPDYESIDKGNLSSRENGYVGGNMTKKMVAYAEQAMAQGQDAAVNNSAQTERPQSQNQMTQSRQG
ncbi:MAG: alpha/beta-type small acid-soluble spore protein [Bacillota bacterium]|nr:alpha/beta-type small acid-soluble spore protein [Bacillota bacterium]